MTKFQILDDLQQPLKTHLSRFKKRHLDLGSGYIIVTQGKFIFIPELQIKKSSLYQHREERMRNKK